MRRKIAITSLMLLGVIGTMTTPSKATPVTVYYVGTPYTAIGDPKLGHHLTGYITVVSVSPTQSPSIVDFSFTSGNYTLNRTNSSITTDFLTFLTGGTDWYVSLLSHVGAFSQQVNLATAFEPDFGNDFNVAAFTAGPPFISNVVQYFNPYPAPGVWTIGTQTPLPSTWLMLLSGLAGFGFAAYRSNSYRGRAALMVTGI